MQDATFEKAWWRRGKSRAGSEPIEALNDLYEGVRKQAANSGVPSVVPTRTTLLIADLESEALCARFTKLRCTGQAPMGVGMPAVAYNGCIWVFGGMAVDLSLREAKPGELAKFEPSKKKWSTISARRVDLAPSPRSHAAVVVDESRPVENPLSNR